MFPAQISGIDPDETSRCEERGQTINYGESLGAIEKTDAFIKESIYHAFWKDAVLRAMEYEEVDVRVKNKIVYLNGHIVNTSSQGRIKNAIQTVPDILGIKNNLILDDKLTLEVAISLGKLEHTYNCKFFTGASHGVISLNGVVGNENMKLLAGKVAANNPNVRGVINNIRISGSRMKLQNQEFQQPTIGEVIYFLDGVSGIVKQVIIDPNNRLVLAMIIQGQFTDPWYEINSLPHGKAQLPEQLAAVPMDAVRYLTKVSGFLYIQSSARTRYLDFDPGLYFAPDKSWRPPYPYCSEDVLFPIQYRDTGIQIVDETQEFPFGEVVEEASIRAELFATNSPGL